MVMRIEGDALPESSSLIGSVGDEAAIGAADLLGQVRQQGEGEGADTTLRQGRLAPLAMNELGIHRAAEHLAVDLLELGNLLIERLDLCGAHEGEIHGIKEEHQPLPLVLLEGSLAEGALEKCVALEVWGHEVDSRSDVTGFALVHLVS